MHRLAAILIALCALIGAPRSAMARTVSSEKTASGIFSSTSSHHARPESPQVLDRVPETTPRDYETASGRPKWPSRDPIGEDGGLNLYEFCFNSPNDYLDYLGWDPYAVHSTGNAAPGDDNAFKDRAVKGVGEKNAKPYVSGQDLLEVCKGMKDITSLDIHGHGNTQGIGAGGSGNGMYIQDYKKPGVTSTVQELADAIKKGEIDVEPGAEIRIFACQCSPFAKALADALAEKRPDIKVTGATSNVDNGKADAEKGEDGKYKQKNGKFVPGKFETHQNGKVVKTARTIPIVPKP